MNQALAIGLLAEIAMRRLNSDAPEYLLPVNPDISTER
jgi:hypothetical protein